MSGLSLDALKSKAKDAANKAASKAKEKAIEHARNKAQELSSSLLNKASSAIDNAANKLVGTAAAKAGGLTNAAARTLGTNLTKTLAGAATEQISSLTSSPGNLAQPFFETGPKTETLVADPKGITEALAINKKGGAISDLAQGAASGLLGSLKGLGQDLKGLSNSLLTGALTGNGFNKDALKGRVGDLLGGRLKDTLISGAIGGVIDTGVLSSFKGKAVEVLSNGVSSMVYDENGVRANSISQGLNRLLGDSSFSSTVDQGARSSMISGLLSSAIDLGSNSLVKGVIEKAGTDSAVGRAVQSNAGRLMSYPDVSVVSQAITTLGSNFITQTIPNAASNVVASFQYNSADNRANREAAAQDLTSVLNTLKPNWETPVVFADVPVTDITIHSSMSSDARMVLASTPEREAIIAISSVYKPENGLASLASKFPYGPLSG